MEITQTPATTPAAQTKAETDTDVVTSDFETFLTLLTAQLENQDPLNPVESQDFATQLATFSGVEQQVKTNDLLESLNTQVMSSGLGEMAGWVGMSARVSADGYFDGTPIEIVPDPPTFADSAQLVVKNAAGEVVQRSPIDLSGETLEWAGVQDNGQPFASGRYAFSVEAYSNGEVIEEETPDIYARVTEVRNENGQQIVVLSGDIKLPAGEVTGLRET
ncbi:flagellar hook capping FlgD N-terminal domain-containing protein [Litoreibacter roseus]|uniref:Basal-body rod modification protein FlgD n=1 Tax=Litoreibacter roseus TaxID=2601869 RepID=A0A6N6JE65_9RHOB|nr:flagellar hook capping FlgD N-terminal domain-containing protein [Litoreibacter roseus]GFE64424.1 basal-body rod modification protein FlgD [Litoreibacter roseus]